MKTLMTFEDFKNIILGLLEEAGIKSRVWFEQDDHGKFVARTKEALFIGRASSFKITTRWGSGHQAMFDARRATA